MFPIKRFLPALLLTACSVVSRDPLLHRQGDAFSVRIDGVQTVRTGETKIPDGYGFVSQSTYWKAKSDGHLCIEILNPLPGLGVLMAPDVIIREIGVGKSYMQWRDYLAEPRMADIALKPGEKYCPKDFLLLPKTRVKTLPDGEYIVMVRYGGTNNWDRQEILVEVSSK